jgi:hypothetical protein
LLALCCCDGGGNDADVPVVSRFLFFARLRHRFRGASCLTSLVVSSSVRVIEKSIKLSPRGGERGGVPGARSAREVGTNGASFLVKRDSS